MPKVDLKVVDVEVVVTLNVAEARALREDLGRRGHPGPDPDLVYPIYTALGGALSQAATITKGVE